MYLDETLEHACSDAWPPQVQDKIGDWKLRAAGGFTGRANSALAVGYPGTTTSLALEAVCEFAHANGIPPMAQAIEGSAAEAGIIAEGWVENSAHKAGHVVSVLTAPPTDGDQGDAVIRDEPSTDWWQLCAGTAEPSSAQQHVLTSAPQVGYGVVEAGGTTAGAVRAALVDDVLHISRLEVRAEFRRRGLARALMAAAGAWGRARGAAVCVLQVAVGNDPALALYRRLGFTEHHRYRYWVPPVAAACEDPTS